MRDCITKSNAFSTDKITVDNYKEKLHTNLKEQIEGAIKKHESTGEEFFAVQSRVLLDLLNEGCSEEDLMSSSLDIVLDYYKDREWYEGDIRAYTRDRESLTLEEMKFKQNATPYNALALYAQTKHLESSVCNYWFNLPQSIKEKLTFVLEQEGLQAFWDKVEMIRRIGSKTFCEVNASGMLEWYSDWVDEDIRFDPRYTVDVLYESTLKKIQKYYGNEQALNYVYKYKGSMNPKKPYWLAIVLDGELTMILMYQFMQNNFNTDVPSCLLQDARVGNNVLYLRFTTTGEVNVPYAPAPPEVEDINFPVEKMQEDKGCNWFWQLPFIYGREDWEEFWEHPSQYAAVLKFYRNGFSFRQCLNYTLNHAVSTVFPEGKHTKVCVGDWSADLTDILLGKSDEVYGKLAEVNYTNLKFK